MRDTPTEYHEALSERELEVLSLLAEGHTNQEIADTLHLAVTTIKWYNTQIYEKLNVRNRREAVARARAHHLLDDPDDTLPAVTGPVVHLPRPTTPFIGRSTEVAEVTDLLADPVARIVTVLGPGGMGKTRLALHIAHQQIAAYRDGVFFVPLAGVGAGDYMITAIAEATRAPVDSELDPKSALLTYFERLDMLLILDNIEHLLADVPFIMEIAQRAPGVRLLVTSRERLNLSGETVYTLGGMMAASDGTHNLATDAAALFMQSARRGRPDFELHPGDEAHLARILTLTQGMPLAIELAAGWMDMLTLPQIADEIQQGIDILETELRDIPDRHRSVRATIQASWERLTASQRDLFMKLSVFRAPFDYDAAQAVAGATLRDLRQLVDKALLYALPGGTYTIHELLRQFGAEHLAAAGLTDATQVAHMYYFAELLQAQEDRLWNLDQEAEHLLTTHHDDLIGAWQRMIAKQEITLLAHCITASHLYFSKRGRNYDGYELFSTAMEMIKARPSFQTAQDEQLIYGHLLMETVEITYGINTEKSAQMVQQALDLLETLPNAEAYLMIAYTQISKMIGMGMSCQSERILYIEKAVKLLDKLTDPKDIVNGLIWFGWIYVMDDRYADAQANLNRIAQIAEQHPIPRLFTLERYMLQAHMAEYHGDEDAFYAYNTAAIEIAEDAADLYALGHLRGNLTEYEGKKGNWSVAAQHMIAYIQIHVEKGRDWQTLGALTGVVKHFYLPRGDDAMCVSLMGFVQNYPQTAANARTEARAVLLKDVARDNLNDAAYMQAFNRFQNYSLREVIATICAHLEAV